MIARNLGADNEQGCEARLGISPEQFVTLARD
jgi:hypothetical protein